VPVYPACCTSVNKFIPSTLFALDDVLLSTGFLEFCLKSFIPEDVNSMTNYLASPLMCPDDILKKFPPTRISVCENDPLRDGGLLFALKLKKAGADVKVDLYRDFIHGFLSFDLKINGNEECHNATIKVQTHIKEFLFPSSTTPTPDALLT